MARANKSNCLQLHPFATLAESTRAPKNKARFCMLPATPTCYQPAAIAIWLVHYANFRGRLWISTYY